MINIVKSAIIEFARVSFKLNYKKALKRLFKMITFCSWYLIRNAEKR